MNADSFKFLEQSSTRSATAALLALDEKKFVVMKGWLDKKNNSFPHNFHTRWVIVKESFMLWSEVEVEVGDPKDKAERIKFKHISLLQVDAVQRVESGSDGRKFKVVVSIGDKQREYLWRCRDEGDCTMWMTDLQDRVQHAKNVVNFLSDEVADLY